MKIEETKVITRTVGINAIDIEALEKTKDMFDHLCNTFDCDKDCPVYQECQSNLSPQHLISALLQNAKKYSLCDKK